MFGPGNKMTEEKVATGDYPKGAKRQQCHLVEQSIADCQSSQQFCKLIVNDFLYLTGDKIATM